MPYKQFDRTKLVVKPLSNRGNKVIIERDHIRIDAKVKNISPESKSTLDKLIVRIRLARKNDKPVILAFGAHAIKNGLSPVLIHLMKNNWITLLATNGAGIIHDWEFAYQGRSSEDVRTNVSKGEFGIWEETGFYINLALVIGAFRGLGYGESVGAMIQNEYLELPSTQELIEIIRSESTGNTDKAAAAADLLSIIKAFNLKEGRLDIPHPYKKYSVQGTAYSLKVPFTGHPMFGHDIIYTHPLNSGAAIGRTALRDFLTYADQVSNLDEGVYISVGSAVMSPMIFEKSMSMSQNLAVQRGKHIDKHYMLIVDLAEKTWNWSKDGEPPSDNPAYYLRYCKSFSRMGGTMDYLCMDNRDFFLYLSQNL